MSGEQPVNPCAVPTFTGDLEALEHDYAAITAAAGTFRDAGANVDSEFQGLSAFYSAPEAAQLFATTHPVRADSDFFADQLDGAAKALGEYVSEARPITARLKELQARAAAFSDKISGDEHWKDDKKKTDENSALIHEISAAVAAFWAAERACADKLRALHGEPPLRYDDGTHGTDMYGYRLEDLNSFKSLPWGTQFEQSHRWYEIDHWAKSFVWDGIIVDGIVGTVRGLGTLVGYDGWDKAGQAWTGLAKLGTGLALTLQPGMGVIYWTADDKALPAWLRDSRTAMKETGKALVAWDEWGRNPARAAGAVTFNVITSLFTSGAGTGVKAGAVAKTIATAGKVGKLIDPMTYVFKAGSYTFTKLKIGELFTHLGKADGAFPKADDVVWKDLPKADAPGVNFPHPDDTVRLLDDALGRPQYFDKTTNQLLDHTGTPKQDLTTVPKGLDHPLAEAHKPQEAPAGVGAHTPGGAVENTAHNSHTDPPNPTSRGTHAATSTGDGPGGGGGHGDDPSTGGHGDGPETGGGHTPGGGSNGDGGQPPRGGGHGDDALPLEERRPFERGGETERQIREKLRRPGAAGGRVKPDDLERVLANLAEDPAGQHVANLIASGRFNGMLHYEQVVSMMASKTDTDLAGSIAQLRWAEKLQDNGITDLSFEMKAGAEIKPGVKAGTATDLDVMARDKDGSVYGYQFKGVKNPKSTFKKILANMNQMVNSGADVNVFIADTKGSVADMLQSGIESSLARLHRENGVIFVIRVEDGTLVYPPGATLMPGGRP